jgi:hypothetical protein
MGAQAPDVSCAVNTGQLQCSYIPPAHCSPFSNCTLASFTPTL